MIENPQERVVQPEQGMDIAQRALPILQATDDAGRAKALEDLQRLEPKDKLQVAQYINRNSLLFARVTQTNELQVAPIRTFLGRYPLNLDGPLAGMALPYQQNWDQTALQAEKDRGEAPQNLMDVYALRSREQKLEAVNTILNSVQPGGKPLTKRPGNAEDQKLFTEASQRFQRGFSAVSTYAARVKKKPAELTGKQIQEALTPLKNPPYSFEDFVSDARMEELSLNERRVTVLEARAMSLEMYQQMVELYLETKQKGGVLAKPQADVEQKAMASYEALKQKIAAQMDLRKEAEELRRLQKEDRPAERASVLQRINDYNQASLQLDREIDAILRSDAFGNVVPFHSLTLELLKSQHADVMKKFQKKDVAHETRLRLKEADTALRAEEKKKNQKLSREEAEKVLVGYPGGLDQYLRDAAIDKGTASERKKGLEQLKAQAGSIIETMSLMNRRMGGYQVALAELTAKQHQFDQRIQTSTQTGGTKPPVKPDLTPPQELSRFLQEQYEGSLSTLDAHFHRMEEGPLNIGWKEKVEDFYIQKGRPTLFRLALKLVQLETSLVPNMGPLDLKKRVQDYLEAGFDEVVGWPRHPDGKLMTEDEINALPKTDLRRTRAEELRLSIERAIKKFEGKNPDNSPILVERKDGTKEPKGNAMEKMRSSEREARNLLDKYPPSTVSQMMTAGPQSPAEQKAVQDFVEGKTKELVIGAITVPPELLNDDARMPLLDIAKNYNPQIAYNVAFLRMRKDWDGYSKAHAELLKDFGNVVNVHMEVAAWTTDFGDAQMSIAKWAALMGCSTLLMAVLVGILGYKAAEKIFLKGVSITMRGGKFVLVDVPVATAKAGAAGVRGVVNVARAAQGSEIIDLAKAAEELNPKDEAAVLKKLGFKKGEFKVILQEGSEGKKLLQVVDKSGAVVKNLECVPRAAAGGARALAGGIAILDGAFVVLDFMEFLDALTLKKEAAKKIREGLEQTGKFRLLTDGEKIKDLEKFQGKETFVYADNPNIVVCIEDATRHLDAQANRALAKMGSDAALGVGSFLLASGVVLSSTGVGLPAGAALAGIGLTVHAVVGALNRNDSFKALRDMPAWLLPLVGHEHAGTAAEDLLSASTYDYFREGNDLTPRKKLLFTLWTETLRQDPALATTVLPLATDPESGERFFQKEFCRIVLPFLQGELFFNTMNSKVTWSDMENLELNGILNSSTSMGTIRRALSRSVVFYRQHLLEKEFVQLQDLSGRFSKNPVPGADDKAALVRLALLTNGVPADLKARLDAGGFMTDGERTMLAEKGREALSRVLASRKEAVIGEKKLGDLTFDETHDAPTGEVVTRYERLAARLLTTMSQKTANGTLTLEDLRRAAELSPEEKGQAALAEARLPVVPARQRAERTAELELPYRLARARKISMPGVKGLPSEFTLEDLLTPAGTTYERPMELQPKNPPSSLFRQGQHLYLRLPSGYVFTTIDAQGKRSEKHSKPDIENICVLGKETKKVFFWVDGQDPVKTGFEVRIDD